MASRAATPADTTTIAPTSRGPGMLVENGPAPERADVDTTPLPPLASVAATPVLPNSRAFAEAHLAGIIGEVDEDPDHGHILVTARVTDTTIAKRGTTGPINRFDPPIALRVTVSDARLLCPRQPGTADFSGTLWFNGYQPDSPDHSPPTFSGETRPHLDTGKTYTFLLEGIDGEWFLSVGSQWVLRPQPDGTYRTGGFSYSHDEILEVCP